MIYKFKNLPLIFVVTPKTASTTILNIINQIDKIFPYDNVSTMNVNENRHKFHKYCLKNNYNTLEKYKHCKIIFFARHPYERVVSGYSKITNGLILNMQFIKNKSQAHCNKLVKNGSITIQEWCDLITTIDKKHLNFHFTPQTYKCEYIFKLPKVFVYDINKLNRLQAFLQNRFNINVKLHIPLKSDREKPKMPKYKKNKIYKYYKTDFDLLKYDKNV